MIPQVSPRILQSRVPRCFDFAYWPAGTTPSGDGLQHSGATCTPPIAAAAQSFTGTVDDADAGTNVNTGRQDVTVGRRRVLY